MPAPNVVLATRVERPDAGDEEERARVEGEGSPRVGEGEDHAGDRRRLREVKARRGREPAPRRELQRTMWEASARAAAAPRRCRCRPRLACPGAPRGERAARDGPEGGEEGPPPHALAAARAARRATNSGSVS